MNKEYDHITDYLNSRISKNKDEADMVRGLIADFALLWNQYERTVYNKAHGHSKIKEAIEQNRLEEIENLDELYKRFEEYVKDREHKLTARDLRNMFGSNDPRRKIQDDRLEEEFEKVLSEPIQSNKIYLLLLITERVRNNMFHGTKGSWDLPKQQELFRICNELLMSVLKYARLEDV